MVGKPDPLKGTALVAFVTLKAGVHPSDALRTALSTFVTSKIGAIARPDEIRFAEGLHFGRPLCPGHHRAQGDDQDIDQFVPLAPFDARIGDSGETFDERGNIYGWLTWRHGWTP